jgi:predicted phosphodiesterase
MKATIAYISDLHIPNWIRGNIYTLDEYIEDTGLHNYNNKADILIIAGDIAESINIFEKFIEKISKNYEYVVLVLGNHDLLIINNEFNDTLEKMKKIREIIDKYNNVFWLDGDMIELKNVKIGGINNWYDVNEKNLRLWNKFMIDAKYMKLPYSIIEFKEQERKKLEKLANKELDIIISHVMLDTTPTMKEGLPYYFVGEKTNDFFNSEENLLKKHNIKAKYHIFGHSHNLYDFKRGDTRYLCNPVGYPNEVGYGLTEDMIKFLEFNK